MTTLLGMLNLLSDIRAILPVMPPRFAEAANIIRFGSHLPVLGLVLAVAILVECELLLLPLWH